MRKAHVSLLHLSSTTLAAVDTKKKIFWLMFIVLGLVLDFTLPLWWSIALTLPLLVGCWWLVYQSGWIDL